MVADVAARLARGEYDLVGIGRALLQDAEWIGKLRDGVPFEPFDEASRGVLI